MANVNFTIGTVFNGEGFKKCQKGIMTLNNHVKSAAGLTAQMAGAMAGMNSRAAQAAQSISGLLAAFASGNPIMVGVQVGMIGIAKVVQDLENAEKSAKEEADKLNEALKRLNETQNKVASAKLNEYVSAIKNEATRLSKEFESIVKHANNFTSVLNKVQTSQDKGKILEMEIAKYNDMNNGNTIDKGVKEAQWNLKIQLEKNAQALEAHEKAITTAKNNLEENTAREKIVRERVALINDTIYELKLQEKSLSGNELEKKKELQSKIQELENEKITLSEEFTELQSKESVLKQEIILAETERKNQILENKISLGEANQAVLNAEYARVEALQKQNEATNSATNAQKEADAMLYQATVDAANAKAKQAEADLNNALNALNDAKGRYLGARDNFRNDNMNLINQMLNNIDWDRMPNANLQNGNVVIPDENGKPQVMKFQDAAAQAAVDRGIADGSIRNLKDAERAERYAARAARDAASSPEANQERRDAQELARLEGMNPKAMSEYDKKKLEKLRKLKKAKDKDAEEADKALEDAKKAEQAVIDSEKTLKEIKEKLEELGLK